MVEITKEMAQYIREKLPDACIRKTMPSEGSKRGTYYAEETNAVMRLISQYRQKDNIVEQYPASE